MHTLINNWWATPLSGIYGFLLKIRESLYKAGLKRPKELPGVVISIGNIEVGGTGKSPVVISLCQSLMRKGHYPVVLTRGYGAGFKSQDSMVLINGNIVAQSRPDLGTPDEAMMQSLALPGLPIVIGANRFQAAQIYLRYLDQQPRRPGDFYWVLDDGFQHWNLKRHLDIVLIYGGKGEPRGRWGDDQYLLPRGRLREPLTALKRASVVFIMRPGAGATQAVQTGWISQGVRRASQNPNLPIFPVHVAPKPIGECQGGPVWGESWDGPPTRFDPPKHCPALLVCGIARPQVFFDDFTYLYGQSGKSPIAATLVVGDHHKINKNDLECRVTEQTRSIVTTAKDFARDPLVFRSVAQNKKVKVFVMKIDIEDGVNLWQGVFKLL